MNSPTENSPELTRAACREFDLALPAYLEGELRPEVERHARECEFCAAVLADLEALRADCRALPEEEPPAALWANLRAALEAEGILNASRPACREFGLALADYLEGEPNPEVERHAHECEYCSVLLADLEGLRDQSRALPEAEPPAALWANVRAALQAEGILKEARPACREFELALAAYLEGEPNPDVELHARECEYCSVLLADLESLREQCRALPAEEPPALVWANVRATLAAEGILKQPSSGFWGFRLPAWAHWAVPASAMAALAVVAGILVTAPVGLHNAGPDVPVKTVVESASLGAPPELAKTLDQLEQNYAARESSLDPGLKATYRKSLDSLDASIKECRESVKAQPSDALAQEYLLAAYTEKAEVLESALEMDVR